jgi:hypothetical protein
MKISKKESDDEKRKNFWKIVDSNKYQVKVINLLFEFYNFNNKFCLIIHFKDTCYNFY